MNAVTIVGILGSLASMSSFAPQAWRIIKTRRTSDLATPTYTLTVLAFAAWTAYGVMLGQWPLIVTNSVCLVLSGFILMMKLLSRGQRDAVADALDPQSADHAQSGASARTAAVAHATISGNRGASGATHAK